MFRRSMSFQSAASTRTAARRQSIAMHVRRRIWGLPGQVGRRTTLFVRGSIRGRPLRTSVELLWDGSGTPQTLRGFGAVALLGPDLVRLDGRFDGDPAICAVEGGVGGSIASQVLIR